MIRRRRGDSAHDPSRDGVRRWGWGRARRGHTGHGGVARAPGPQGRAAAEWHNDRRFRPTRLFRRFTTVLCACGCGCRYHWSIWRAARCGRRDLRRTLASNFVLKSSALVLGSAGLRSEVRLLCIPALSPRQIVSCDAIGNFISFALPSPIISLSPSLRHPDFFPFTHLVPSPISSPFYSSFLPPCFLPLSSLRFPPR